MSFQLVGFCIGFDVQFVFIDKRNLHFRFGYEIIFLSFQTKLPSFTFKMGVQYIFFFHFSFMNIIDSKI